jgi:thiamine biosynthesis lipoprotein
MKQTRLLMGMPIAVELVGAEDTNLFELVYGYFQHIDETFSTYKDSSEISKINAGLPKEQWSTEVQTVLDLCEETKQFTNGYFDVYHDGKLDPSGLVKGWAINNAAELLQQKGLKNFCIDAGGDMQVSGANEQGEPWRIGIRNPFNREENIKIVSLQNEGIATSGTAIRGQHIYNPLDPNQTSSEIASISVIGPDVYHADRFATAAFAMGTEGLRFISSLEGFEAYLVKSDQMAIMTEGFDRYVIHA